MARIAGVDLPRDKRVEIGLTYIYGIGRTTSLEILKKAGISPDVRVKDLSEEEVGAIRKIIDSEYHVEGDLRREVSLNIKRLMETAVATGESGIEEVFLSEDRTLRPTQELEKARRKLWAEVRRSKGG